MGNNPISLTDPDGGCTTCPKNAKEGDTYIHADYDNPLSFDGANWLDSQGNVALDGVTISPSSLDKLSFFFWKIDNELKADGRNYGINVWGSGSGIDPWFGYSYDKVYPQSWGNINTKDLPFITTFPTLNQNLVNVLNQIQNDVTDGSNSTNNSLKMNYEDKEFKIRTTIINYTTSPTWQRKNIEVSGQKDTLVDIGTAAEIFMQNYNNAQKTQKRQDSINRDNAIRSYNKWYQGTNK